MARDERYEFRKATMRDLALLKAWQTQTHVQQWWDDEDPFDEDELADKRVRRWIVLADCRPFAYMQDYTVHGWDDHHFAHLPDGARGIDQYIGDADMLGVGHGTAFIRAKMRMLFEAGAPMIATDPHPDNARAIAAYKKVGFEAAGPAQKTRWGVILPMQCETPLL